MSTRPTCTLTLLCVVQGCERFAFTAIPWRCSFCICIAATA